MVAYMPRVADSQLTKTLSLFGAVLIDGPKWCGKTTTASQQAASAMSLTDPAGDFASRRIAMLDPSAALKGDSPRLIDEWQEAPKLWDAVRFECDRRGRKGLFILTGSATPNDANGPMHSGAGRIARIRMETMTLFELGISTGSCSLGRLLSGMEMPPDIGRISGLFQIAELVCKGGWPEAANSSVKDAMALAREYIDAVCESDASRVDGIARDPDKVSLLLTSLARNESTLASQKTVLADIANEISRSSASRYIDVLKRLNLVEDIPAWNPALRSPVRLRGSNKHHLCDPSIAASLIGADPTSLASDPKTLGLLFESLALHDLMVYAAANDAFVSHYHDTEDLEADAIVWKRNGDWIPVEVKLGAAQVPSAAESLSRLEKKMLDHGERPPASKVILVGFGEMSRRLPDGTQIVPIDTLGV